MREQTFIVTPAGREAWLSPRGFRRSPKDSHNYDFWVVNALVAEGPQDFNELLPVVRFGQERPEEAEPFLRLSLRRLFEAGYINSG